MAKNILLMVTGMTPQIITETVYGLAVRPAAGVSAWLPDEIQVISTQDGLTQIRDRLFDDLAYTKMWRKVRSYKLASFQKNPSFQKLVFQADSHNTTLQYAHPLIRSEP